MVIMGRFVTASLLVVCLLVSASASSTDWSIEDATRRVINYDEYVDSDTAARRTD